MYLFGVLKHFQNNESINGGSHNNIEAPHDFSLNFLKGLAWFQNRVDIEPI